MGTGQFHAVLDRLTIGLPGPGFFAGVAGQVIVGIIPLQFFTAIETSGMVAQSITTLLPGYFFTAGRASKG